MTTKELMLGDWVYDRILNGNTKIVKITANHIRGDIHEQDYPLTAFEPILITKDILRKNGFDGKGAVMQNDDKSIIFTIKGFSFASKKEVNIALCDGSRINNIPRYVHLLQHALRVSGLNELADTFKV